MQIDHIVKQLILSSDMSTNNILNRNHIIKFINEVRNVLFIGYNEEMPENKTTYLKNKINIIKNLLTLIMNSLSSDTLLINDVVLTFINSIPSIKKQINGDLTAFLLNDPAVNNEQEVIHCYPGFYAISLYRIANVLANLGVLILPRIICEHAHSKTGIDIHPNANIGENFFIDHGTGVVIGETTIIGRNVKIYQGVTLGAISLSNVELIKNKKRHPTIEDNVTIYSNTSILGGQTVIGENSIIGCNVFLTKSVEKNTKVVFNNNIQSLLKKVG